MINHLVEIFDLKHSEDILNCIEYTLKNNSLKISNQVIVSGVDKKEIQTLNLQYRKKDKPTNILSFTSNILVNQDLNLLGELVICEEVLVQEAKEQNKSYLDHLSHIVIHGTLHLLGYDHETKSEAFEMEQFEVELLNNFNIKDPYL
jgi:probable rRNA maturation factor